MKQIEKLYIEYKQDVYIYLLHLTNNPILSEDLLQETFVKCISSIGNFKGNSSVKTWLFSIARHLWLQSLRRKKPELEYNDLLQLYVHDSLEDSVITKLKVDRIILLLSEKDELTQKVIRMRVIGASYSEISDKIGISENSARVINFRTKRWLKSVLKKEGLI
ncbi:MAG: RNA polymerase sigma factor [Clostridia bacterium]|nr:RNA polymerase sigma factor [Clostridia bacterium]